MWVNVLCKVRRFLWYENGRITKIRIQKRILLVWYTNVFFLTLFYYILGNYERAIFCLNKYINTCSLENDEYYQQVLLLFKSKLISDDNLYNSVDIEIRNNFENRHKLFAEIEIPKCPDCNSCTLINYCYTTDKAKYSINILNEMNKHIIEQNLLWWIFYILIGNRTLRFLISGDYQ